jgi:hypothetical protein
MGMRPLQVLWRVELPFALPLIFAGVRTATVYVVAIATLATFAGGGGLGDIIVNEPTYGTAGVIAGLLTITLLAFSVDGALALVPYAVTPRLLRKLGRNARVDAAVEHTWGPATVVNHRGGIPLCVVHHLSRCRVDSRGRSRLGCSR